MCGIVGYVGVNDPEQKLLHSMADTISYRGPDGCGYFHDKSVGFGHRRLRIIDLATGGQPMFSVDRTLVVVFNGEIYNYQELKNELAYCGYKFQTNSDTEVILAAYAKYGYACVERFNGMFAFAIWDTRKECLFLARDRLGIKPLYYTIIGNRLLFASEIKSILCYSGIKKGIDHEAISTFLTFTFVPGEQTLFAGILRLPPAHTLIFESGQAHLRRYWNISDYTYLGKSSEEKYTEQLRDILQSAIKSQLISDVPLGVALSGGLDSSAITAFASQEGSKNLQTFTVGYGCAGDEYRYAREVANRFNTSHHEECISFRDMVDDFPSMVWHLEEPSGNYVIATTFYLARYLKNFIKTTLIGEGSDELFAGYTRYKIFSKNIPFLSESIRRGLFLNPGYFAFSRRDLMHLFRDEYQFQFDEILRKYYYSYFTNKRRCLNSALTFEIEQELPNSQLNRIDKLMMAHSIEARVPFLDHRMVEFSMSIPEEFKLRGFKEKYILRHAMSGILPQRIAMRQKGGLSGSQYILGYWLQNGLLTEARRLLSKESIEYRGYFRWPFVAHLFDMVSRDRLNLIMRRRVESQLYMLTLFEIWHRVFFDRSMSQK